MKKRPKKVGRKDEAEPVQNWGTTEKRIAWLVATRFHGNKSEMAGVLDLTHMVISRVVAGKREAGPRLIRRIIEKLGVNAEWLLHGRGEPFPDTATGSPKGRIPVFEKLLAGRLTGASDQQAERWVDGPGLLTPTQYWFVVQSGHPLPSAGERGFRAGDLLLLETDPTRFPPPERLWERLCVFNNPSGSEPPVRLGLVSYYEATIEEGPARLEADTFDGEVAERGIVEEFIFRRYPGGQVQSLQRKLALDRKGAVSRATSKNELVVPTIRYGDLVAVWTGVLLRHGYARPE